MADRYEYSDKHKTATFRSAFVHIFDKPQVDEKTQRKTWNIIAILAKPEDKDVYKRAFNDAAKKLWGDKAKSMVNHPKFRSPFKDGDDMRTREGELYAGFEPGQIVVKLTTSQGSPGVVDRQARAISSYDGRTLVDKEDGIHEQLEENAVYSGCHMRATFCAQAYDRSDGFGVSFKLENLQKIKDDEKLGGGGRSKPEEDFEPIDDVDDESDDDLLD